MPLHFKCRESWVAPSPCLCKSRSVLSLLQETLSNVGSPGEPFFQRAEIRGLSVVVDYWPRRLDLAALKAGNLAEVLNLAPWGSVLLQLPPVRLSGVHGWPALGAAVGEAWLRDVVGTQVLTLPKQVTKARP